MVRVKLGSLGLHKFFNAAILCVVGGIRGTSRGKKINKSFRFCISVYNDVNGKGAIEF